MQTIYQRNLGVSIKTWYLLCELVVWVHSVKVFASVPFLQFNEKEASFQRDAGDVYSQLY